MLRIAHLSDPHVNLKFHPAHLARLKRVLLHALREERAEHIIITGDLSSNSDARDLRACRKLFQELGILSPERLSLVIGNHDIYGGPHLAEELLAFPGRCTSRDYDRHVQFFHECFAEAFVGSIGPMESPFPYAKRIENIAILGVNSISRHGVLKNPVGSNGEISEQEMTELKALFEAPEVVEADHRILLLHHHLFRRKDESSIHTTTDTNRLVARIEHETLKLRGKRKFLKTLAEAKVDLVLHGHVHFTGEYVRKGILCLNGAGAVYPVNTEESLKYNLITVDGEEMTTDVVEVPSRWRAAASKPSNGAKRATLKTSKLLVNGKSSLPVEILA